MREKQFMTIMGITLVAITAGLVPVNAAADFTISASPTSFHALFAGLAVKDNITVTSTGGFAGTVTFSGSATNGIALSFSPTIVTLSSGGQASTTLSITADENCNVGNGHTIVATGTSGSLSHNSYITWQIVVC